MTSTPVLPPGGSGKEKAFPVPTMQVALRTSMSTRQTTRTRQDPARGCAACVDGDPLPTRATSSGGSPLGRMGGDSWAGGDKGSPHDKLDVPVSACPGEWYATWPRSQAGTLSIQAAVAAGLPGQRRLLADPKVTAMVVDDRDQLARMNVDLIRAAFAADGCPRGGR
jgi:hypothetical protein